MQKYIGHTENKSSIIMKRQVNIKKVLVHSYKWEYDKNTPANVHLSHRYNGIWSNVQGLLLTAETLDEPVADMLLQPQQQRLERARPVRHSLCVHLQQNLL